AARPRWVNVKRLGIKRAGNMGVERAIEMHRAGLLPGQRRNDEVAASTGAAVIGQDRAVSSRRAEWKHRKSSRHYQRQETGTQPNLRSLGTHCALTGLRRCGSVRPERHHAAKPGSGTPRVCMMRKRLSSITTMVPARAARKVSRLLTNCPMMSHRLVKIRSEIIGSGNAIESTTWLMTSERVKIGR